MFRKRQTLQNTRLTSSLPFLGGIMMEMGIMWATSKLLNFSRCNKFNSAPSSSRGTDPDEAARALLMASASSKQLDTQQRWPSLVKQNSRSFCRRPFIGVASDDRWQVFETLPEARVFTITQL